MAALADYVEGFFGIGSKATKKANQKDLLERLLSYEAQSLTTAQKIQVLSNLDISVDDFAKAGTETVTSGKHTVYFANAYGDDNFTATGEVRSGYEIAKIIVLSQTIEGFTYYAPMAGEIWWTATKHNS